EGRYDIPPQKPRFTLRHLTLTPEQVKGHYQGFSNSALWPLCHSFMGRVRYESADWRMYEEVNQYFAEVTLAEAGENDVIWVQDYQLARVPYYLRRQRPAARLLFFWHIPFPPIELFRTLPWRKPLLEGLLACDVVGFHIPEYTRNFARAAEDLLQARLE